MTEQYAREILRRNVAQICQTIGWNGIHSTPLDILVHILEKYLQTLGTQTNRYAEQFNRTEPNLNDLGLVFQDLNIQIPDLAEYTRCVPPVPLPFHVDKFPRPKESNLNFLKPGSHEVVTRPMHVHEHLPPMYPEKERETPVVAGTVEIRQNGDDNVDNSNGMCTSPEISVTDSPEKQKDIFKRPNEPVSLANSKRPRLRLEEEEKTREISSVMMTMSGFLSPAREGKLPEARPPTIIAEKHYDKHKPNSHHSHPTKVPVAEKSEKKSKKNKLLNGKIMKSKRKDKSHKSESSKSKDSSKVNKHSTGHTPKSKDINQSTSSLMSVPKGPSPTSKSPMPPPPTSAALEVMKPVKQEPIETTLQVAKSLLPGEDAIPVPRKIPISKSPLISNPTLAHKASSSGVLIPDTEIKKEITNDEEKLASQPDRSKINIFKRISNKSKEEKSVPEVVPEKSQPDSMISKLQNPVQEISEVKSKENTINKTEETIANNNDTSAVDLSKDMDLRAHEVISIDDDSLDTNAAPQPKHDHTDSQPSISLSKSLQPAQAPHPKDVVSVSPKIKKEKKHKDKKDKAAKLEAKLLKKQQQALAYEMAQAEKQTMKAGKPPKSTRPKNESKMPQMPPGFPFFPGMSQGRNLMPGPGLIPNPGLIPGNDFLSGLANNPALRGLPSPNLLTNPFALSTGGPGLIPGAGFLPGNLGPGMSSPLMPMSNYPHSPRSSSVKIPPMLRRPSLEVIPVENNDEISISKSPMHREKDRHDKHKSSTIPNILQKHHKKSHKDQKALFKMPPVLPDITIELNPPKELPRQEQPKEELTPQTLSPKPIPKLEPPVTNTETSSEPLVETTAVASQPKETEVIEKKKDKSHKKEKKDKDGLKIKKKKDKKDKNKDKSEKKREKVEKSELKEKLKKEKKEKKKEKLGDGLVPKLTLKLSSSNSNSPMPPSSPDVFKLNIKPVVKKEEEEESSPMKEEPVSREHSHSPELAQISALVTRPPKQKYSKHNIAPSAETEPKSSSPPSGSSPTRKNRPPSSHSKYKRILFKPLSKKGHFEDDMTSIEEPTESETPTNKPSSTLPTPYYLDEHGNKIWVCPACGRPDNGSPMIGCDGCDGWYHWVCVGITEEPGATEDWFCKSCIAKRAAMVLAGVTSGKKRGRKPKGEKIRDCH